MTFVFVEVDVWVLNSHFLFRNQTRRSPDVAPRVRRLTPVHPIRLLHLQAAQVGGLAPPLHCDIILFSNFLYSCWLIESTYFFFLFLIFTVG